MDEHEKRPIILIICDYYLPGFENGGSTRTLANMVDRLCEKYDFRIVTRDYDGKKNKTPYTTVNINDWNRVGSAMVYYVSRRNIRIRTIKQLISELNPAAIYTNSFFSPFTVFTLILRRTKQISYMPIILAPDGELSDGSLSIKPLKKQLYMRAAKLLKLYGDITWKAASELETHEIKRFTGTFERTMVAPCLAPRIIYPEYDRSTKPAKNAGRMKIVFLSRIMRTKNLHWLLNQLNGVKGELDVYIYGPIEDAEYWQECSRIVDALPVNITVFTGGTVQHQDVPQVIAKSHFFVLPTLGENFGHVFIEALAAGCPLLISDRTPWTGLEEKGIGWDLSLEEPAKWVDVLNKCLSMGQIEYDRMSEAARVFAVKWLADPEHDEANRRVLQCALGRNRQPAS